MYMEEKKEEDGMNVVSSTEDAGESTAVPLSSPSPQQSEKERILLQLTDEELLMEFS